MPSQILNTSAYFLNPYAIPILLIVLAFPIIAISVLRREKFTVVSLTLYILGCATTLWLTVHLLMHSTIEETIALWWARALYLGIPFIPAAMYHFTVAVLQIDKEYKKSIWMVWSFSTLLSAMAVSTDLFVNGMYHYQGGYSPKLSRLNNVTIVYVLGIVAWCLHRFRIELKKNILNSNHHRRINSFMLSFAIGSFGLVDYLTEFSILVYPFGYLALFAAIWIFLKTIRRYHLVDITPRLAAQGIIDMMNDFLVVLDTGGVIRLVNKATTELLGRPEGELLGSHFSGVFADMTVPGRNAGFAGQGSVQNFEYTYGDAVRGERILSFSASLMKDEKGQHLAYIYIGRDITGVKQTEAELIKARDELEARVEERSAELKRANEQMAREITERKKVDEELSQIFNLVPDMIAVASPDGFFQKLNPAWEKTLGYTLGEMLSKPFTDFVHPDDVAATMQNMGNRVSGESMLGFASRYRCKDGAYKWLEWVATPSQDKELLFAAARDITDRKRAEDDLMAAIESAETANRAKSEFLATMSHEIRTPLNAIIGLTELSLMTTDTAVRKEYLEMVKASGDDLLFLINDILDLAKIESGELELEKTPFDLRMVVQRSVDAQMVMARRKGLNFMVSLDPAVSPLMVGDPERLRQIITNLVSNAVKFTEKGAVELTVKETDPEASPDSSKARLHFIVKDTGIGIPTDKQAMIFESFSQADRSTARKFGGSGLGTAIAKKLVKLMGGGIWLESADGAGTEFHFTVEFDRQSEYGEIRKPRKYTLPPCLAETVRGKVKLNILLAENNYFSQRVFSDSLRLHGHKVTVAENGINAVAFWKREAYDAIFMDIQMPGMTGLEATEAIRRIEKERGEGHVTIIAVSANALSEDMEKCLKAGMDGYISKPIDMAELASRLTELTRGLPENAASVDAGTLPETRGGIINLDTMPWIDERGEMLNTYVRLLLDDLDGEIGLLEEAIRESNAEKVWKAAHTVKGMAGHFRTGTLLSLAADLERLGREGLLNLAADKFAQLKHHYGELAGRLHETYHL